MSPVEGTPVLLEFRDKYGRLWRAPALAGEATLSSTKHEGEVVRSLEDAEEIGMKLQSFKVVLP